MKSIIKEGDIVLAPFRFSETEERKLRPCLVFSTDAVSVSLVCITSQKLCQVFETEVVLTTKESASIGLVKQSKMDFMKRDRIPFYEVVKALGHISSLPRARIAECFKAAKAAYLID
jgi:mRNA-degrading endonuclease toxin of MazEF toxin-antitoxin module